MSPEDLVDDGDYADFVREVTGEVAKYGALARVVVPRPGANGGGGGGGSGGGGGGGGGLVFLVYDGARGAGMPRLALHGRTFGGDAIGAALVDERALAGWRERRGSAAGARRGAAAWGDGQCTLRACMPNR